MSQGALILALRQEALGERFVPRSIGLAWDQEFDPHFHRGLEDKIVKDDIYGREEIPNCIEWLFTAKQKIEVGQVARRQGTLYVNSSLGPHTVNQKIYISDTETKDGMPVDTYGDKIKLFGRIQLILTNKVKAQFTCKKAKNGEQEEYFIVDYMLQVKYNGTLFEYDFIIPKSGTFSENPTPDDDAHHLRATFKLRRLHDKKTQGLEDDSEDEKAEYIEVDESSSENEEDDDDSEDGNGREYGEQYSKRKAASWDDDESDEDTLFLSDRAKRMRFV